MPYSPTKRFIILIGGPARFMGCDKEHDQTWNNYIVPMQIAAEKGFYHRQQNEIICWLVYEPPYIGRWQDDSVITAEEKKQDDGYHLHSIRKAAADKVKKRGATNYLSRIQAIASQYRFNYKGINTPKQFWDFVASCPPNSISRVWYCGHASGNGLMLALNHNNICAPSANRSDMIRIADITAPSSRAQTLADRFETSTSKSSKFYGCFTDSFAKTWNNLFHVPTQGAVNKITFGCIDRPSDIPNILTRLEQTPASGQLPQWRTYP
jgi:hypothetical protein